jgi:hypothetical protein
VNIALAAAALAVAAGAVVAVSIRELRAGLIGLAVVLVGGSLLNDPFPAPATLGVRIVGGLLVVAILQATLPESEAAGPGIAGSAIGWPAEALLAAAAALAGLGIALTLLAAPVSGADVGQVSGLSRVSPAVIETMTAAVLFALGAAPAALGRSGGRRAIGLVLLAEATVVLRTGLAGPPGDFEQIAIVGLLLGCAAVGAVLARAADLPAPATDEIP